MFFYIVASVSYERSLEELIVSGASVGESYHQEWFVPSERNFIYIRAGWCQVKLVRINHVVQKKCLKLCQVIRRVMSSDMGNTKEIIKKIDFFVSSDWEKNF
jgi:hypothetical protein